jgi:hypothetical protein
VSPETQPRPTRHASPTGWSPFVPAWDLAATVRFFLTALSVVYLLAFLSLAVQIQGLIGSRGILPVAPWLDAVAAAQSGIPWTRLPTLLWLSASDAMLSFLVWGGALAALIAALGWARGPLLAVCWAFYLSLVGGGQDFLSFQWDVLLLEAGFLALFVAPWGWRRRAVAPPRLAVWLLRLLLFKLMLSSGLTKLTWGDPTWADLTALEYHYWTQPLPTPLAWWAAQLPGWFQRLSCLLMFGVELVAPFGAFGPRRLRLIAAAALVALQVGIAATGNYGFFNLLSIVLCIPLLDDRALGRLTARLMGRLTSWRVGRFRLPAPKPVQPRAPSRVRLGLIAVLAVFTVLLTVTSLGETVRWSPGEGSWLTKLRRTAAPWMVHGSYGLFRVMTTTRPEIEIEVSDDGRDWHPLVFRYKPGPLDRRPPWVAPHMPRLDWQMWFAALSAERLLAMTQGRPAPSALPPWLIAFARAVLEGRRPVLDLLEGGAGKPPAEWVQPRWIRMTLWQYRFAPPSDPERRWWTRERVGTLLPAVSLER